MRELRIQSIADVITNSSSEIFVIKNPRDTSLSEEAYRGIIRDIKAYAELYLEKAHAEGQWQETDDIDQFFRFDVAKSKYFDESYEYHYDIGDLLIESWGDNSIPWEVMEFIEDTAMGRGFECRRTHLG